MKTLYLQELPLYISNWLIAEFGWEDYIKCIGQKAITRTYKITLPSLKMEKLEEMIMLDFLKDNNG